MSQIPINPWTDRQHLTTAAYADSANLTARADIYHYQQPHIDIVGWALDQVQWRGDEQVVDVGCGPGSYLGRLAQRPGLRLIGVDLSRGMLADLQRGWDATLSRPRLAAADVQSLPLPDASCDVALAMHMLYHVPDIPRAAHELRRVLRHGGVLLALTNGEPHMREMKDLYDAALAAVAVEAEPYERIFRRFTLENGADFLQPVFNEVDRRDVASALVIPEAEPVLRYIASTRSVRELALPRGVTWDMVMAEIERIVAYTIAEQGVFRVSTRSGAFVCR